MCTGYRGVFAGKPIGYVGAKRMDRQYMVNIEARAKKMTAACRPANIRTTAEGREKRCARCGEWWPMNLDFFYRKGPGYHSYCKACHAESRRELQAGAVRKILRRGAGQMSINAMENNR